MLRYAIFFANNSPCWWYFMAVKCYCMALVNSAKEMEAKYLFLQLANEHTWSSFLKHSMTKIDKITDFCCEYDRKWVTESINSAGKCFLRWEDLSMDLWKPFCKHRGHSKHYIQVTSSHGSTFNISGRYIHILYCGGASLKLGQLTIWLTCIRPVISKRKTVLKLQSSL